MSQIKAKFIEAGAIDGSKLSSTVVLPTGATAAVQTAGDSTAKIATTSFVTGGIATAVASYIPLSQKNAANGVCPLDGTGKVAASNLPAYVDDVLEYANLAAFPATGSAGLIYVTLDTNLTYRWSGSVYTQIAVGAVQSVNGSTGIVTLSTTSIGEGTNLYFTNARAQAAAVAQTITSGVTTSAPSQDAVFTALAAKANVVTNNKEVKTLIAGDITSQFIDLAQVARANSINLIVDGSPLQREGTDYTVNLTGGTGGKTRLTFAGDLATAGLAALVAGDVVRIQYEY